jgi:hypothetical protein
MEMLERNPDVRTLREKSKCLTKTWAIRRNGTQNWPTEDLMQCTLQDEIVLGYMLQRRPKVRTGSDSQFFLFERGSAVRLVFGRVGEGVPLTCLRPLFFSGAHLIAFSEFEG